MYRLTALVFLLSTVFSHASAEDTAKLEPAHPGVPAHAVRGVLNERADNIVCEIGHHICEGRGCCPTGWKCCRDGGCCSP